MPKVISADKKACIKRSFGEYKKDRPDFTNEQIFERLSRIFEVISFLIWKWCSNILLQVGRNSIIDILKQDFEHLESSFCGTRPKTDKFLNHVFRKDLQSLIWQFNSQNQYFTLDTLLTDAREKLEFEGGRTTLHKILKSMGYKYRFSTLYMVSTLLWHWFGGCRYNFFDLPLVTINDGM
jgi:hypothetical protein